MFAAEKQGNRIFDHTSVLRFLETRFGVEVPNLSAWRRATVGNMISAFNFSKPDTAVPVLPTLNAADITLINGCISALTGTTPYPIPHPPELFLLAAADSECHCRSLSGTGFHTYEALQG